MSEKEVTNEVINEVTEEVKTQAQIIQEAFDELRKFEIIVEVGKTPEEHVVRNAEILVPSDTTLSQAEAYAKNIIQERVDAGDPLVADMMEFAKTKQIGLTQDNKPVYLWTDEDDIKYATLDNELTKNIKKLVRGRMKLSEGYNTAWEIYQLRQDIQAYNSRRWEIYGLTADAAGEEAVHKFLCTETAIWEDGERIFTDLDDFETEEKRIIRNQVIAHYMKLVRLQNDYSAPLETELKFFQEYGFMNGQGDILDVNKKRVITNVNSEFGAFYDDSGNYVEPVRIDG